MNHLLLAKCLGELIGSFILTFGVIMAQYTSKQKAFGLDTKLKQRGFLAVTVMAAVVVGITVSFGFGRSGFINPAVAFMMVIAEPAKHLWKDIGPIIGFEMIGGLLGGLIAAFVIKMIKISNPEATEMKEVFNLPNQSILKTTGMEWFANIFWLLPVVAWLLGLGKAVSGETSVFQVALVAGISFSFIVLVIDEHGGANLNPQVWFGLLAGMVIFNFKSITKSHVINGIVSTVNIFAIAALIGVMGWGIHSLIT